MYVWYAIVKSGFITKIWKYILNLENQLNTKPKEIQNDFSQVKFLVIDFKKTFF